MSNAAEAEIAKQCGIIRGTISLGMPVPFLYFVAAYLTFFLKWAVRLFLVLLMLALMLKLHQKLDNLRKIKRSAGCTGPKTRTKILLHRIAALVGVIILFSLFLNPSIPPYIKGILASVYYLLLISPGYSQTRKGV